MTIRAAVLREAASPRPYGDSRPLHIESVQLASPAAHEIRVRIAAAGLCHSDLSVIDGNRPRPLPMVLGHEAAGEVIEVGAGVRDLTVGDHVVFSFVPTCGHCAPCRDARPALCEPGAAANGAGELLGGGRRLRDSHDAALHHHLGVSGFAEEVVVSRQSVVRVDNALPFEIGALFGCAVMTGVGAVVNTARVRLGESVLIAGLGGIGFAALLGALASGASQVIVADVSAHKLQQALALGAHAAVNSGDADAVEQVRALTRGGADVGLECAGVVAALDFTWRATRRGGRTVTVGLPHPSQMLSISPVQLVAEERTLQGSYLGSCVPARDIPAYVALYQSGRLPVDKLLTHRLALDEINEGFERLARGEAIRQVILF
ncbi:MAG TPA: zinc-dependent alcohol dehydrogenase family protein [Gemmatimonas sp.]|uniref:zinc-dependent alcohol dehydrogenase family protein n=1 Tax=Gemmatimonas sp. TaxID=1962908 RepID=UPI002EDA13E0